MRSALWRSTVLLALAVALGAAACDGDDDDDAGGGATPKQTKLGGVTFNDHGTGDARGKAELSLEADNFYFSPTFVRGDPGKEITLKVANESGTRHNLTVAGTAVDSDVDANGTVTVKLAVPADGVVLFFCKYHAGSGMNGEVLAGNAAPKAVDAPASGSQPAASPSAGAGSSADPY